MTSITIINDLGTRSYYTTRTVANEMARRDRFQRIGIPCHVGFAGPLDNPFEPDDVCGFHAAGGCGPCSFCEEVQS